MEHSLGVRIQNFTGINHIEIFSEQTYTLKSTMNAVKKTRGRKRKDNVINATAAVNDKSSSRDDGGDLPPNAEVADVKRRGRKPKGGKLIQKPLFENEHNVQMPNVILHLRCSMKDLVNFYSKTNPLEYNPSVPPEIMAYDGAADKMKQFSYYQPKEEVQPSSTTYKSSSVVVPSSIVAYNENSFVCNKCKTGNDVLDMEDNNDVSEKDVNTKLKKLRIQFYKNMMVDKKSACFWCTYEFDNPPCFIPKYELNDDVVGYGSFCRPECAVGYLMRENLDDSTKFERYFLLNQIYAKVYGFKKNIKPAPDPHFVLEKFYGNLTIQEYRRLLRTENMLTIMEKPMTRILPEIHEDNDEFILNIYGGTKQIPKNNTGIYRVKRQSEKQVGPSKMDIMKDKFGI